jgi:hypothetical protein
MFGLPDSWFGWGTKKAVRAARNATRGRGSIAGSKGMHSNIKYSYRFKEVIIYEAKLKAYLNTPDGHLWGILEQRGRAATVAAKQDVGVKTGRLRASIYFRHVGHARGQYIQIGSIVPYAYDHHQGTRAHDIRSKPGGPDLLKFPKKGGGGGFTYVRYVRHPGTRGNPFLSKQLPRFFGDLGTVHTGRNIPKLPTE